MSKNKIDPMWQDFLNYFKESDVEGLNNLKTCVDNRLSMYSSDDIKKPFAIQIILLNNILKDILNNRYE